MRGVRRRVAQAVAVLLTSQVFYMLSVFPTPRDGEWKNGREADMINQHFTTTGAWANCSNSIENSIEGGPARTGITNETVTISCRTFQYRAPRHHHLESPSIIFGILSNDPIRRANVRLTWAKELVTGEYYFVVAGEWTPELEQEYYTHLDILWLDKPEVYRELTYKTGAFVVVANYYYASHFTHLFKTDDDSYIHVEELQHALLNPTIQFFGNCHIHASLPVRPDQKFTKKWMKQFIVSYTDYPERYNPPYCSGAGYALSHTFVNCIAQNFKTIRTHPFEDVAMGLMAERCHVNITHTKAVHPERKQYNNNMKNTLVQHRATTYDIMKQLHESIIHK